MQIHQSACTICNDGISLYKYEFTYLLKHIVYGAKQ